MQMAYCQNPLSDIGQQRYFDIAKRKNNGKKSGKCGGLCYYTKWCNGKTKSAGKEVNEWKEMWFE